MHKYFFPDSYFYRKICIHLGDRGQFDLSDCGHLNCPLSVIIADLQNGARSVNLITGDKPADVYSGIAAR
jgi:hypothetical protein